VEGKTNREYDVHGFHRIIPSDELGYGVRIIDEKIVVLEYKQHEASRYDTYYQPDFPGSAFGSRNFYAGEVINENRNKEDENVLRYEEHVKHAAAY
jgi:hypothetical protein